MSAAAWDKAARWVWYGRSAPATLARTALLPAAALYRAGVWLRNSAYDAGALPSSATALPSVGIGNLAVGGSGKSPVAAFVANALGRRGIRSAVVLRGYGGDEPEEYRHTAPGALVVAGADRAAAAQRAEKLGAEALVFDDCLQRRDALVDVMLVLGAAESWQGERWALPAGPWREGPAALMRADAVVVTRKTASVAAALAVMQELAPRTPHGGMVADLALSGLRRLGPEQEPARDLTWLRGREVLAVCGIAAPDAFRGQLAAAGARVELAAFGDHHAYTAADVAGVIARAGARPVVTTGKDAVKLARWWPVPGGPECLVAALGVRMTHGAGTMDMLLHRVAAAARRFTQPEAASVPLHHS